MKKFYLLFAMLFTVMTAFAQEEVTVNINSKTGEWTAGSAATWAYEWATYSDAPQVTIANVEKRNNMAYWDGTNIQFYNSVSYSGTQQTYRISVSVGYIISAIELDFVKYARPADVAGAHDVTGFCGVSFDGVNVFENESYEEPVHASIEGLESEELSQVDMIISGANPAVFANTSNFVIKLINLDDRSTALAELISVVQAYEGYLNQFVVAPGPGNYGEDEVTTFRNAIEEGHNVDGPMGDEYTAEQIKALTQAIKDAYEAVLASRVPMTLADGFYRIKAAMQYYIQTTEIDPETEEENTKTTYVDKYMYSVLDGNTVKARWASVDDPATDCPSLWKVTNAGNGTWKIENMATESAFNNVTRSTQVTMTIGGDNRMSIDPLATIDGVTYVDIRVSTQDASTNGQYLHQGGHGSGKGTNGNVVGYWSESSFSEDGTLNLSGTEWVFEPVDEATAQAIIEAYKPIQDEMLMRERYKIMLADAKEKLKLAKDEHPVNLITSNEQFSSPYTETREGSINNLLDGNTTTYWHSDWSASVPNHTHYLQVALVEPVDADIYLRISRRPVVNDHVTLWGVMGSNNAEAADEEWEELASLDTPYGSNTETKEAGPFSTKGYQHLRFYIDGTSTGRGYGHVSEFQLFYYLSNPNAQANFMGDLATNLENVINAQKNIEIADLTMDEYNALKEAYDAFMAKFTDPTELRQTLAEREGTAAAIKVGTNPGFWASDTDAAAYTTLYNEAKAYDEKGDYTPEKSANYVEQLNSKAEALMASAIGIKEGKWYRIRFATEEDFDTYGWNKNAGRVDSETSNDEPLFGKYVTVAKYEPVEGAENGEYNIIDAIAEDVTMGENLFFDDEEDIVEKDLALFRFVSVGDSAYILQNKGTNMFVKAAGGSGAVTLSSHPSLFTASAIGYGLNAIAAKSITGDKQNYLHGQKSYNVLVTWNANTPGTASALYIEEAGDVTDYEGRQFNVAAQPGAVNTFCFPVEISSEDGGMYDVAVEGSKITLCPIEKAVAGRPFIYILDEPDAYVEGSETEIIAFNHGYDLVTEPQTQNALKGTFSTITLDRGEAYAKGNTFVVNTVSKNTPITDSRITVGANRAYISVDEKFDLEAELEVSIDETIEDGIAETLNKVTRSGAIYTLDGRLVSTKGNLNDLRRSGKGLYIINGVKVIVK